MLNQEKVHSSSEELIGQLDADTKCIKILPTVLSAVNWQGTPNQLSTILSQHQSFDEGSTHLILLSLGYTLEEKKLGKEPLSNPAIAEINGSVSVILKMDDHSINFHDGDKLQTIDSPKKLKVFEIIELPDQSAKIRQWSWTTLQLFWPKIVLALLLSSILGLLALVIPLFTRHVYDMAIPSKSVNTLVHLGLGAILAMSFLLSFRFLRVRIVASICRSWTYKLSLSYGKKILNLPFLQSTNLSFQNSASRFKEIDNIRNFFINNSGLSLLDLPFLSIALITIFITGGWLVLVPLISIALYVLLIPFFNKLIRNASASSAYAHKEKNNLELDLVRHSKAINQHGLKNSWLQRYHKLNKVTVKSARNQLRLSLLMQNTSFVIGQFTSLATMATGIYLVMLQKLSAGDLIAAMMLARRVTSPIQASAMSFNKLGRFKNTLTQIDRYIPLEDEQSPAENIFNSNAGVSFENVVFRYGNNQDPALSAVSFETEANKTIAIAGPNNSGKTTLINILSKCLDAQSGKVLIGKSKLKNISSNHFRTEIAYAGEWLPKAQISIIKYLQELLPLCSESHIRESCGKHNLVSLLKEKNLDLDSALLDIHDSFLKKYIAVIHLLIKDAPIILIDVNFNAQYQKEKDLFVYLLDHFHGKKTVFYTTLCADLMQLADSALILDKGAVAHFGPIEKKAEASS